MDILNELERDHREVSGLFNRIQMTTERAARSREDLFAQLMITLESHAYAEENVFYAALQDDPRTEQHVLESIEEHGVMRTLLHEIEALPAHDEHWIAKISVLAHWVGSHVAEEESAMFDRLRFLYSAAERELMAERFLELKADFIDGGNRRNRSQAI